MCLRKERWGSSCPVALHLGLSGLVLVLILQGPHNKASGLAQNFLWVRTHSVTLTFPLTGGYRRYELLSGHRSAGTKTKTSCSPPPLKKREGERRYSKVEHPQCLLLMLHWVCPITAVLSDWLCVGWWAQRGDGALAVVKTDFIFKFMSGDKFVVGVWVAACVMVDVGTFFFMPKHF